ncbi:hypothetical protein BCR43DRAFT_493798 [Syncephalastrum racemosum]|uniref:Cora-domain-containing protein n=1 Tax=Syncephalastrum racemosum TaxID=13706 RepID=A0A1X2HB54_SYNRA|nr:hypothetical protein BCR43DRAFT_493798 [Syncephalastrum racemosum]
MDNSPDHAKRVSSPTNSDDFVLQMERDSAAPTPSNPPSIHSTTNHSTANSSSDQPDVLHPLALPIDTNATVQADTLHSYIYNQPDHYDEPDHELQRQYAARLDDLLDGTDHRPTRRVSLYGEKICDPTLVRTSVDRYVFYSAEHGTVKSPSLRDLLVTPSPRGDEEKPAGPHVADLLQNTSNWWVDIFAASTEELRALSKIFRIHPLTTEDIQAQESREKCEIFQNYMFISFRSFNHDMHSTDYLEAVNFYIIILKTGVLTFHFQPVPHPHNVRRRIHQLKDFIHVTPEWINYALIDDITDSFAPLIQHTELEVDSIDDLVLVLSGSEQTDMLRRIGSCRKTVMQLLRLLGPKADVVRSLIKRYSDRAREPARALLSSSEDSRETKSEYKELRKVQHEVTLYLGDIQDHIISMLQNVNHYDITLGRAHRNYLGQISIELSQSGNTTNEMINRLTFLATVVVPLNLVAGLWGMNVHVPGEDYEDLTYFYWIVLGMVLYIVAMLAAGRRFGYL